MNKNIELGKNEDTLFNDINNLKEELLICKEKDNTINI